MQVEELNWQSKNGEQFFGRKWDTTESPEAVVCLVHGMGEHSGRYEHVAAFFNSMGYAVIAFDHRGHGKSAGKKGHTPSYEQLLDDVGMLVDKASEWYPGKPKYLYGHSMGGNLVLGYALRRDTDGIKGLIVTSPWLRLAFEPPAIKVKLAKLMKGLWPSFTQPSALDTKAISRDLLVVEAYENDPLVHDLISAAFFFGIYEAGHWILAHANDLKLPLLLMHGSADRLTSSKASEEFAANAPKDLVTFRLWDGLFHEIHNEPEKKKVFEVIRTWLETHQDD